MVGKTLNIKWDARGYADEFSFVHKYGEDVLLLLDAPKGSSVIDLGCGNGALTAKLRDMGYNVTGIDASGEMLEIARQNHPGIKFIQADATTFKLREKADAVFANAVFHWIDADKQETLLQNIADNLRTNGQLVFEFGGKGCGETVHAELEKGFSTRGLKYPRVFYFPTIGEYAPIMEKCGFLVQEAYLFDRPTPQKGKDGLREWINMFVKAPFEGMTREMKEEIINEAAETVKDKLFVDGTWIVDYVRIRMKSIKIG